MEKYGKAAMIIDEQIALLEKRGLDISNADRIARHLSNIRYYRISAYRIPCTTWNDINSLYRLDRKLRLIVFDVIERIEIVLRIK